MTRRLYYADSSIRQFDAVVVSCAEADGRVRVVLDQTAFYPSSGGQPFDTGRIGPAAVVDVIDREAGEVEHVVSAPVEIGARLAGEIDWPRRFDHMQQHTGQHVLSAAFGRVCDAPTLSFHMGTETSTIDLGREVSTAEMASAESEANRVVWEDRPVDVRFVTAEEASRLPLRKPPARGGELRLVDIRDFDLSACGGTHVATTGVIGLIGVTAWERFKGGTRVSFVCGGRALRSHRELREVVAGACRSLSVAPADLGAQIERVQQAARDADRKASVLQAELSAARAREWGREAQAIGHHLVVLRHVSSGDGAALKQLAQAIVGSPRLVAALIGQGQPAPVVVARAAGVDLDAGAVVRSMTAALGGRGGGRPELAQAGVPASPEAIVTFLRQLFGAPVA
jgi:alanyl-tRNA synthetase